MEASSIHASTGWTHSHILLSTKVLHHTHILKLLIHTLSGLRFGYRYLFIYLFIDWSSSQLLFNWVEDWHVQMCVLLLLLLLLLLFLNALLFPHSTTLSLLYFVVKSWIITHILLQGSFGSGLKQGFDRFVTEEKNLCSSCSNDSNTGLFESSCWTSRL